MASKVYGCIKWFGRERIERTGFSLVEASKIRAPVIDDCKAHLECRLDRVMEIGSGFVVFGEIVAASIWEQILVAERERQYQLLSQIVFLEDNLYSRIDRVATIDGVK
jgi:flavin reductase (DIM6/NTAB) family NADH-FMN oxidoreductase RutF